MSPVPFYDSRRRDIALVRFLEDKYRMANVVRDVNIAVIGIERHLRGPVQLCQGTLNDAQRSNISCGAHRVYRNRGILKSAGTGDSGVTDVAPIGHKHQLVLLIQDDTVNVR